MNKRTISGMMLTLLIGMLMLVFRIETVAAEPRAMIVVGDHLVAQGVENILDVAEPESTYVGIAKYYDNRKCVVTSTQDDMAWNTSKDRSCLSMLTEKKIYHTAGIITNRSDWSFVQYWVDQGYTEAGSHSRNHVHVPYIGIDPSNGQQRISYEWQINGSKNDIIGNLTLPDWWRLDEREYVYTWIEPYGSCNSMVRQWLGYCHYLCDRRVSTGTYGFAQWDYSNGLFTRVGYTVEMGSPPWGGDTSVSSLNNKFDIAYNGGKIYHLITHPSCVDWGEGKYADKHTDYISGRTDVWYVPFGILYLYHWVNTQTIVDITSTGSGLNKVFKLSVDATDHLNYGVAYPITHVFDIPPSWTSGYVYYRHLETDPWTLMGNKSSGEFFNGIDTSRFDFANCKAYVSIGFSNVSHNIYLQLRHSERIEIPRTIDALKTEIEELGSEGDIDNHGLVTSLTAKLNVAQKLIDNGKIDQARKILNAFINEVQAQSGKHITPEVAEILIESAEYILSHL